MAESDKKDPVESKGGKEGENEDREEGEPEGEEAAEEEEEEEEEEEIPRIRLTSSAEIVNRRATVPYFCGRMFIPIWDIPSWAETLDETRSDRLKRAQDMYRHPAQDKLAYPKFVNMGFFNPHTEHNDSINEKVALFEGNPLLIEADIIVNATTERMDGKGTFLDAEIRRLAGRYYIADTMRLRPLRLGECKASVGHGLPARNILHVHAPAEEDWEKCRLTWDSILSSSCKGEYATVVVTLLTGDPFAYPLVPAAHCALQQIRKFLDNPPQGAEKLQRIILAASTHHQRYVLEELMEAYFPAKPFPESKLEWPPIKPTNIAFVPKKGKGTKGKKKGVKKKKK